MRGTDDVAGRFRLHERIGRGGSSAVHRADDTELDRTVAVKILHKKSVGERLSRFVSEARTTARLDHPGIVPVHALGRHPDGRWFFAMKAVEGQTFGRFVGEANDWPTRPFFERAVEALVKVSEALAFAHAHDVVHRDVKPDNIMVGAFGQVYLMDWGIARAGRGDWTPMALGEPVAPPSETLDGQVVGTPEFMAPEQAHGQAAEIDGRTDVFALGATLWYALARRAPFARESLHEALDAAKIGHAADPRVLHPTATLPASLCRIAMRAMSPARDQRYPDVVSMREDMVAFLRGGERAQSRRYAAGAWIVRQGEVAKEAYRILSGRCRVVHEDGDARVVIREMGPGEPFGETGVFGPGTRSASVQAISDVVIEVVRREDVDAWLEGDAWLAPLVRVLAARFREADAALHETGRRAASLALENALLRAALEGGTTPWIELVTGLAIAHSVEPSDIEAALRRTGLMHRDGRLVPARSG